MKKFIAFLMVTIFTTSSFAVSTVPSYQVVKVRPAPVIANGYQSSYNAGYNAGYHKGKSHQKEKFIKGVVGGLLITAGVVMIVHAVNSDSNIYANSEGKVAYRF